MGDRTWPGGRHSTVTTEQGLRSVRGANVSLSDFPGALLATGHQPSYTSNLSTALAPGAPDPGQVQATISTNRAQTLRQQVLTQTGRIAGGPFEQNQTMSGDMKVFEESFSQDQSATWGPLTSGRTWVGVERPSSATRLQKLSGERTIPVSDTDLRTTKYQALPPIRVEHTKRAATPPPFEPPTVLFIGITAHIYAGLAPEDNRQIFDDEDELSGSLGMRKDFVDRRMFEPSSPDPTALRFRGRNQTAKLIQLLIFYLQSCSKLWKTTILLSPFRTWRKEKSQSTTDNLPNACRKTMVVPSNNHPQVTVPLVRWTFVPTRFSCRLQKNALRAFLQV